MQEGTKKNVANNYVLKRVTDRYFFKYVSLSKLLLLNLFRATGIKIDASHCYLCCLVIVKSQNQSTQSNLIKSPLRALRNYLYMKGLAPVLINIFIELSLPETDLIV